jgi:signal transduction histidine kinase
MTLDLRPLDPVRSIKAKLGLLVATSIVVGVVTTWVGFDYFGWRVRYSMALAVGVALALTQVLAHGMTSPLRQMTAAARAMAAGKPVTPVRTTSRDEVGELARAFIAMSRDLAAAESQRRDLLANVAHELKTPVAALRAQLENLVDGVRAPDPSALAEALEQTERLAALVTDLLDLARAESGTAPLRRSSVAVRVLADDVAHEVGIARPGRRVVVDVPAGLVADADAGRLRQVLVNLVDNAARHATDDGRVDVRCRSDGAGGVVVEVTDDGPGIPRAEWDAVFERFRLGTAGPTDSAVGGGTGLGLAIARWAVVLHGGRIAVVGSPRGCRIRAELPAAVPTAVPTATPTSRAATSRA